MLSSWLGLPPLEHLPCCGQEGPDAVDAVLLSQLEAGELAEPMWGQEELESGLLDIMVSAIAQEQGNVLVRVAKCDAVVGAGIPVQLNGGCGPLLQLFQLSRQGCQLGQAWMLGHQTISFPELRLLVQVTFWKVDWQWFHHLQLDWVGARNRARLQNMLWQRNQCQLGWIALGLLDSSDCLHCTVGYALDGPEDCF